jgi:HEAT repeat protein
LAGFVLMLAATAAADKDALSVAKQIEHLKSTDAKVRYRAVRALKSMGPRAKGAVGALIEALGDESSGIRIATASALGSIGPSAAGATEALVAALKDEKYWVRWNAAAALGKIGPGAGKSVGALINVLKDDNTLVRRHAVDALAAIGKPTRKVIDALEEMLKDKEVSVRLSAAKALVKLGEGKRAVDTLVAALKHNDIYKRRDAVGILETIGSDAKGAAIALLNAVKDAEGWRGSMAAAREAAMKRSKKKVLSASEEELIGSARGYQNNNWRLRFDAARALGIIDPKIAGDSVVPVLIKLLRHDTPWVRHKSTETLGTIGKPALAAIPALKAILANERHEAVCLEAHETLRIIRRGSPTTRPARSDGLLAWLAANGSTADSAGTNDGRIVGNVTFTTDRHGAVRSALAFNRDGGRVVIPDSDRLDTDDAFTLSAWIIRTHDGVSAGRIVSKWQDATREGDYALSMIDSGQMVFRVAYRVVHSRQDHIYSNSRVPRGRWTHVAAAFDRGEMKLYINGIFDAGKKSTRIKYADWREYEHDDISIGASWDGKFGYRGAIDEIRIYGRALSASEIHTLFGGPPRAARNAKTDRVELRNGSIITGTITNTRYVVTTAMGKITIPAARVAGIISGGNKIKGLRLQLTDSQVISGTLVDQTLQIDGPTGKTLKIPPGKIVQCGYRITHARPVRSASTGMVLTLRNGDQLVAEPAAKLQLKSPYASLIDLPSGSIVRIDATARGGRVHRVMLANGSRLSGTLMPRTLAVKLQLGPKLEVRCEDLAVLSCPGGKRSAMRADAVLMKMANGDRLPGRVADKNVSIRTEFGDITPAWGAVESIQPGKNKGVLLKMRNGAVYRGRLIGPHLSFAVAGQKRAIKVKVAQISSITPFGKPSPKAKD